MLPPAERSVAPPALRLPRAAAPALLPIAPLQLGAPRLHAAAPAALVRGGGRQHVPVGRQRLEEWVGRLRVARVHRARHAGRRLRPRAAAAPRLAPAAPPPRLGVQPELHVDVELRLVAPRRARPRRGDARVEQIVVGLRPRRRRGARGADVRVAHRRVAKRQRGGGEREDLAVAGGGRGVPLEAELLVPREGARTQPRLDLAAL
mmetsp:Transcript_18373/g.46009  ORF Transcript_18373/g.46009 Transcript_18373/m.46009 type:complete len:205 (+) Transcript_18373:498-1112(+)